MLDFTGGFFSLMQTFVDGYETGSIDFAGTNSVKFGLGLLSMIFDVIFMTQHYVLYPKDKETPGGGDYDISTPNDPLAGDYDRDRDDDPIDVSNNLSANQF